MALRAETKSKKRVSNLGTLNYYKDIYYSFGTLGIAFSCVLQYAVFRYPQKSIHSPRSLVRPSVSIGLYTRRTNEKGISKSDVPFIFHKDKNIVLRVLPKPCSRVLLVRVLSVSTKTPSLSFSAKYVHCIECGDNFAFTPFSE